MDLRSIFKLMELVRHPLVVQCNTYLTSPNDWVSKSLADFHMWDPDPRGGSAWCIQSFCLYDPRLSVEFMDDVSVLYSSRLIGLRESIFSETIAFKNLNRCISFGEGTAFGWGLYFAKYFRRSLIINLKNPLSRIDVAVRPEHSLEKVLLEWQSNSVSKPVILTQLSPSLLCMSE